MSAGNLGPNQGLIGRVGSRSRLNTPALILDLDAFERNMAVMSARVKLLGLSLRPHAKAHKSGTVGRRQVEAGAIGISCATLDEAEAMVGGGVREILVTSPVVGPAGIDRSDGPVRKGGRRHDGRRPPRQCRCTCRARARDGCASWRTGRYRCRPASHGRDQCRGSR